MKKAAALAVLGSALAITLSLASAHPDGARPGGVTPGAWIPLTPDAGFVVTGNNSEMVRLGGAKPTVTGYLMVRHNGEWVRLESEATGRVIPAR